MDWQRQPGEPIRWFSRFEIYRLMGPDRSMLGAFKFYLAEKATEGQTKTVYAPKPWYRNAESWNWRVRAEAWDAEVLEERRREEEQRRTEARERRIKYSQNLQMTGAAIISKGINADELQRLAAEEARGHMNVAVRMVMEGMNAERLELGEPTQRTDITSKGNEMAAAIPTPVGALDLAHFDAAIREVLEQQAGQLTRDRRPAGETEEPEPEPELAAVAEDEAANGVP